MQNIGKKASFIVFEMAPLSICFPRYTSPSLHISATPTFRHKTKGFILDLNLFSMLSSETANMSHPPTCHTSCPLCILSRDKKFPHRTQPRGSQGKKGGREVFGAKNERFRGCVVGLETRHPLVPITDRNAAWNIHESGAGRNKTNISGFACTTGADEELLEWEKVSDFRMKKRKN